MIDFFVLDTPKTSKAGHKHLQAIYKAGRSIGLKIDIGQKMKPCKALIVYGLGGADRFSVGMFHVEQGGLLMGFDLGYWDRNPTKRKFRFTLNGLHTNRILEIPDKNCDRFMQSKLTIARHGGKENGPIMLVGNAPKSISVGAKGWTAYKSKVLKELFPQKTILYRPKPKRPRESGVIYDKISDGSIDSELSKCSLVVTRHSNVAVDACRLGVPCVSEDGAASAIYPHRLEDFKKQPTFEKRKDFLYKLAWWQWSTNEAVQFWKWFLNDFPEYRVLKSET